MDTLASRGTAVCRGIASANASAGSWPALLLYKSWRAISRYDLRNHRIVVSDDARNNSSPRLSMRRKLSDFRLTFFDTQLLCKSQRLRLYLGDVTSCDLPLCFRLPSTAVAEYSRTNLPPARLNAERLLCRRHSDARCSCPSESCAGCSHCAAAPKERRLASC